MTRSDSLVQLRRIFSAPNGLRQADGKPEVLPFVLFAGPDVIEGEDGQLNESAAKELVSITERLNSQWPLLFFFKCSYDKANRTSVDAYRGPGVKRGVEILERIKASTGAAIITDVHTTEEIRLASSVADVLQIPAFLSRQTDLLVAAGETGLPINLKKGQFLSPHDIIHGVNKIKSTGNTQVFVCERGATFGYNNLVVDFRSVPIVQGYDVPVIFDATHSVQLPGGQGGSSGGQREYAITLARAAAAAGCNGLFLETHPQPDLAPCDGPNMIPISWVEPLLEACLQIREITLKNTLFTQACSKPVQNV